MAQADFMYDFPTENAVAVFFSGCPGLAGIARFKMKWFAATLTVDFYWQDDCIAVIAVAVTVRQCIAES